MTISSNSRRGMVLLAALTVVVGCGTREQIRTYTAPKEVAATPSSPAAPAETGEPRDRMLTVIVPAAGAAGQDRGQAWYYKVVGPIAAVGEREEEIIKFVGGVPETADGKTPAWKLPEGWTSRPGSDGVTLATIAIPAAEVPLNMSVSLLPWMATPDGILIQVNRWRGQMGLAPLDSPAALAESTREVKTDEKTMTVVDLRGVFRRSGMTPPFAGGAVRGGTARGEMPAGHPPVGGGESTTSRGERATAPAQATTAAPGDPTFTAPESWTKAPPREFGRFAFRIADGQQNADVTISSFAASSAPMISDPLANVNRWRGEIGMPPIGRAELAKTTESIEIDGRPATYVPLIPDVAQLDQSSGAEPATLGVMATVGDQIWYIKMKGSRNLVAKRQDEFKAFLQSLRFAAK